MITTRFAPSPTGDLHLGGVWTALASWVLAHREGGRFIVRIEDIDTPRIVPGSSERILEDLAWLGLESDEAPVRQSERTDLYEQAIHRLTNQGLTYLCDCSRAEIARVASAPHAGEEAVYPGVCRGKPDDRAWKRPPAIRVHVATSGPRAFVDRIRGEFTQRLERDVGDFVLRRADGVFAYQLVVAVDDAMMGITDVVRGDDLLASTPRQLFLIDALGLTAPAYWHLPLVTAADGARLAKRTPGGTVRALREAGISAAEILGSVAHGLGLAARSEPRSATEIAALARGVEIQWPGSPWRIPAEWTFAPTASLT